MKKLPSKKTAAATLALAFALVATPAIAVPYDATCSSSGGSSSFTAVKRGWYFYAWRTGTTANGRGVAYLRAGQQLTLSNPGGLDNSSRFGVLTGTSTTYAYVYCDA